MRRLAKLRVAMVLSFGIRRTGLLLGFRLSHRWSTYSMKLVWKHHLLILSRGYLHVGHAKAAMSSITSRTTLSKGRSSCGLTIPTLRKRSKNTKILYSKTSIFLESIVQRVTYTSDYFEQLYKLCQRLISDGNAYAEDTDTKIQKMIGGSDFPVHGGIVQSARASRFWRRCARGQILVSSIVFVPAYSSTVKMVQCAIPLFIVFRDGRKARLHGHITELAGHGTFTRLMTLRAPWLTIEGVTHALRTTEYADRNEQYAWFLKALNMRHVHLWDFARINFIRTFLSERKLCQVIESGRVTGWDDPRMPTVRGILRRGLTINTLREFMLKQGPSRNNVTMDWTILWTMNKKAIDPTAPRQTTVETKHHARVTVIGGPRTPRDEA